MDFVFWKHIYPIPPTTQDTFSQLQRVEIHVENKKAIQLWVLCVGKHIYPSPTTT